jgi:hypothetical protein
MLRPVQELAEPRSGVRGEEAGIGDGVVVVQAQGIQRCVRSAGALSKGCGVPGAGGGQLAESGGPFVLQSTDGSGDGGSDRAVHTLELTKACHVLCCGDGGESPEGEQ